MLRVVTEDGIHNPTLGIVKETNISGSEFIRVLSVDIPATSTASAFKFIDCEIQLALPDEDKATTIARLTVELNALKKIQSLIFENTSLTIEQIKLLIYVSFYLNHDLQIVVNETVEDEQDPSHMNVVHTSSTMQQYGKWLRRWRNYWWKEAASDADNEMRALIGEYQALITKTTIFQWHFHYGYAVTSIAVQSGSATKVSDWSQHEKSGWGIHAELTQYLNKLNRSNRTDLREMKLIVSNLLEEIKIYFPFKKSEAELIRAIYYMSFGAYEMTRYLVADLMIARQSMEEIAAVFDKLMQMYYSVRMRIEQYKCLDKEILRLYLAHTALMLKLSDYLSQNNVPIDTIAIAYLHAKEGQERFINLAVLANVKTCGSTATYDIGIGLCIFISRQIYQICDVDDAQREKRVNSALAKLDQLISANANTIGAKLVYIHIANEMLLQFEAGIAGVNNLSANDVRYLAVLHRKLSALHQKWGNLIRPSNFQCYAKSSYEYQAWCATNMMKIFDVTYLYRAEEINVKSLTGSDGVIPRFQLFRVFTKFRKELPNPLQLCAEYLDRMSVSDPSRAGTILELCTAISHQSPNRVLDHRKYFSLLMANLAEWASMCVNEVDKIVTAKAESDVTNDGDYAVLQDICNYTENVAEALMHSKNNEALHAIYSAEGVTVMHIHMLEIMAMIPDLKVALGELRKLALKNIADKVAAARARPVKQPKVSVVKEPVNVNAGKKQPKKTAIARAGTPVAAPLQIPLPAKAAKKIAVKMNASEASTAATSTATIMTATKAPVAKRQKIASFVRSLDQLMQRRKFKEVINAAETYLAAMLHEDQKIPLADYPHLAALYYRLYESVLADGGKSNAVVLDRAKKYLEAAQPYLVTAIASGSVEEDSELGTLLNMMQGEIRKYNIASTELPVVASSDQLITPPKVVEPVTIQYDNDVKTLMSQLAANISGSRVYTFGSHNTAQVYKAIHADGFEPHVSDVDLLICVDDKEAALAQIKKVFPRFYHSSKLRHLELFRGQFGRWKIDLVISTESAQQFIERSDLTIKSIVADEQGNIIGSGATTMEDMKNKKVRFMPGFAERFAEYADPTLLMNYIRALIIYPGFEPIEDHLQFVREHASQLTALPNALAIFQKHFQSGNAKLTCKLWHENGLFAALLPDVAATLPNNMQVYLDFCEQFDYSFKHYGRYDAGTGEYVIACLLRLAANISVGDVSDGRHEMWYAGTQFRQVSWLTKAEHKTIRAIVCHHQTCKRVETNLKAQSSTLLFGSVIVSTTMQYLPMQKNNAI